MEDRNLFLTFLNDNIGRMNANSMNCKTLMAALNAGLLAVYSTKTESEVLWIAIALTFVLYLLDCYYLMLEKNFRDIENHLLNDERENKDIQELLFKFDAKSALKDDCINIRNFIKSLISFSTWWLYLTMIGAIVVLKYII